MTTCGVEIEFILAFPESQDPFEILSTALSQPITYDCPHSQCPLRQHSYYLPLNDADMDSPISDYTKWTLTTDISVDLSLEEMATLPKGYDYQSIELVSRVLNFRTPTPLPNSNPDHCPLWKQEVEAVLYHIRNSVTKFGAFPIVNQTAGLHVHVGHENGHSDKTVRGVMATFTALERNIDTILPTSRISGYDKDLSTIPRYSSQRTYNYPWTRGDRSLHGWAKGLSSAFLSYAVPDLPKSRHDIHVPAWLHRIANSPNKSDLLNFFDGGEEWGHQSAVNLENLDNHTGTIEFRCHAGSLSAPEIIAWMDFVCSLTDTCARQSQYAHFRFLIGAWQTPDYTFLDLATYAGSSLTTQHHYRKVLDISYAPERYLQHLQLTTSLPHLQPFNLAVEQDRLNASLRPYVRERIREKLETGRYGGLPAAVIARMLDVSFLDDNADPIVIESYAMMQCFNSILGAAAAHDKTC